MSDTTQDKISYIGARLREKSTYGGLAVAVGMLLPLLTKYVPQLADTNVGTVVSAISDLGIGLGLFIGIFLPEKGSQAGVAKTTDTVVKVLLVAFALSAFLANAHSANAQGRFRPTGNLVKDIQNANSQVKAAVTGKPADPTAALPCMDIRFVTKLTPENLVPTMKACAEDLNSHLVSDTQRALDSATAYVGPNGGNPGDNDAVNCLKPALALFKAAAIIPAVPAVPAVLNADGTVKTPAVDAVPEQDPGPILLFQKYREFVLAGAITSCQSWVNTPVNATIAAGAGGLGAAAGAAVLTGGIIP
jgi:hypothetical protein